MTNLKTPEDLLIMREAGRIVARVHMALREMIKPGVTTGQLNSVADDIIRRHNAVPTFIGYPPGSLHPFPAAICASVNEELVHGIPGPRVLHEGDIISVDVGATYRGFVGDGAFTMGVGKIAPEVQKLIDVAEEALYAGIRTAVVGNQTRDISMAIQAVADRHGYGVIREYTGHGVGRQMHEGGLQIPNWWPRGRKQRQWPTHPLQPGMTFALEPMFSLGHYATRTLNDHWTVVMADGSPSVHVEHTIAVTDGEPLILTLP